MKLGDDMKSNKIIKIIIIIISICILLLNFNVESYAISKEEMESDSTINGGTGNSSDDPIENPKGYKFFWTTTDTKLKQKAGVILGVVNVVGVVIAVATVALIGIKYMLGSVEEKSEYKKTLIPYLIGAVLVFSGTTIPNIIYLIARSI